MSPLQWVLLVAMLPVGAFVFYALARIWAVETKELRRAWREVEEAGIHAELWAESYAYRFWYVWFQVFVTPIWRLQAWWSRRVEGGKR